MSVRIVSEPLYRPQETRYQQFCDNFRALRATPTALKSIEQQKSDASQQVTPLSERKITHLDIFILFFKIMELFFDERATQREARMQEHAEQLKFLLDTTTNFSEHGDSLKKSAIAGAIAAFLGAFLPMFGYTSWGEKVKEWIPGFDKMPTIDFFKKGGQLAQSSVQVSQNYGQVQTTFREGDRAWSQQKTEMARSKADECTRVMQHTDEDIRNVLNFFARLLENDMAEVRAEFSGN